MDTLELKNRIKNYLEHADERILKILNAIIEAEQKKTYLFLKKKFWINGLNFTMTLLKLVLDGKNWNKSTEKSL